MEPVYSEAPGIIHIDPVLIGKTWGPMRLTPTPSEDITDRVYTGTIYDANNLPVANMVITKLDNALGVITASMDITETNKLRAGTYTHEISYTDGAEKRAAYAGSLIARNFMRAKCLP